MRFYLSLFLLFVCCSAYAQIIDTPFSDPPPSDENALKPTQTVLLASPAKNSIYSQPVTFIVNVVPSHLPAPTPKGTVKFEIDGTIVDNQPLVKGTAKFTTSSIPVSQPAQHRIKVVYLGDDTYNTSKDSLDFLVSPAQTILKFISKPNPSSVDQTLTFTARVSPVAPGSATPEGSVEFQVDGTTLATPSLDAKGQASFSTSDMRVGSHTLTAFYKGHTNFKPTSKTLTQQINKAETTTTLNSLDNPSIFGQTINVTATVTSPYQPLRGRVQFKVDENEVDSPLALDNKGQATLTLRNLQSGQHTLEAVYLENANFKPSNALLTQEINKAETTTTLNSSDNPSTFGQVINVTAAVSAVSQPLVGKVQFKVDEKDTGTSLALNSKNQATIALRNLQSGQHTFEADYLEDANFKPSNTLLKQEINKAETTTTLMSSENPSIFGQVINVTALVTSAYQRVEGKVQFKINEKDMERPIVLNGNGQATITLRNLNGGPHKIEAAYLEDANFKSSHTLFMQQINKAETTLSLISSENPSVYGQPLAVKATVTSNAGEPGGNIQFKVDGKNFGDPYSLRDKRQNIINLAKMGAGSHQIEAEYLGTANFQPSNALFDQKINKAETNTTLTTFPNPSPVGEPVNFVATVNASEPPTGTIQFQIEGKDVANPLSLQNNQAFLTVTQELKVGKQAVRAIYVGDENFKSSSSQPVLQEVYLPLLPPTELEGFQISRPWGNQIEWINVVKWAPPSTGEKPVAYHVYLDPALKQLAGTVSADQKLGFIEENANEFSSYSYFIVSVNASGKESEPVIVKIVSEKK